MKSNVVVLSPDLCLLVRTHLLCKVTWRCSISCLDSVPATIRALQLLKEENFELKTKLTESNAGFKSALETARLLLAEIEESGGTLPPLPESPMPHIPVRNHVQA
jgi:hypothetical protein